MRIKSLLFTFAASVMLMTGTGAQAQTQLKVFMGGQKRPEVMKEIFATYMAANPGIKVELETGGATSELQQKYLNTVLSAGDAMLDVFLVDINLSMPVEEVWLFGLPQHAPCVMDQCVTLTRDGDVAWLTGVDADHCHPKSPLRVTAEAGRIRIEQA